MREFYKNLTEARICCILSTMKRILKLILILLMVLGLALSVANILSTDNMAMKKPSGMEGTRQSDGTCVGEPLNC